MKITSKKYNIGYGKPPEHSKWKKGQCGNPKRIRKRPVKPVAELVDEFFAREVEVIDDPGLDRRRGLAGAGRRSDWATWRSTLLAQS
jgi:hypothetical protein